MGIRPVWAEVDLAAIKHNFNQVKKLIKPTTKVMAIVKANGYGHGAFEVGRAALEAGADYLGVAFLEEALKLRTEGLICPIMLLGWTPPEEYPRALENRIILTIYNLSEARILNQVAGEMGIQAQVHLKIDTGMSRIGILAKDENIQQAMEIINLEHIWVDGIFTHLSKADERDKSYAYLQLERFKNFTTKLEQKIGRKIPLKHAANSAAIIDLPEAHLDLVRPGIILYGLKPSLEVNLDKINLKPALSLKARITRVERFPEETMVGYGGTYKTQRQTIIATIPIGYADGYTRLLSNKAQVLINQKKHPVIGKICMDQCMVDVTEQSQVKVGDEVILIGKDQDSSISMDEIAYQLGTINYEIACMISERVPRIYTT